jgi:hypothetical protein
MIALVLMLLADPAQSGQSAFTEGVQAQLESRPLDAQAAWLRLARGGLKNADLEYNLGTSCAESNDLGAAVLHLKRSLVLRPSADASGNLHVVRERVLEANPGHTRELSLLGDVADQLVRVPFVELTGGALVLLSLLLVLQRGIVRRPMRALSGAVVVSALAVAVAAMGASVEVVYHDWRPPAVVLKRTRALSGPDERFKTISELGAGEEVRLAGKEAAVGFVAIELPTGETAFVADASVAKVKDW